MGAPVSREAGITVGGVRELRKALKEAEGDLSDLKELNAQVARIVALDAKGRAPVGDKGWLKKSVRYRGTPARALVLMGSKRVPYANPIHWGRVFWPNKDHVRAVRAPIKSRPFLSEAAQATEPKWTRLYFEGVEKLIEKIGESKS